MGAIISLFGMIMSAIGMGTSTIGQVRTWQNQPTPPAQMQPYRCPPNSQPQMRQLPDGSYQIQCVATAPGLVP
jgi:hypothetical protein